MSERIGERRQGIGAGEGNMTNRKEKDTREIIGRIYENGASSHCAEP